MLLATQRAVYGKQDLSESLAIFYGEGFGAVLNPVLGQLYSFGHSVYKDDYAGIVTHGLMGSLFAGLGGLAALGAVEASAGISAGTQMRGGVRTAGEITRQFEVQTARKFGTNPGRSEVFGYATEELSGLPCLVIKQKTPVDCMTTAIEMLVKERGGKFNVAKFGKDAGLDKKGTTFNGALRALDKWGIEYKYLKEATLKDLIRETATNPVIIGLRDTKTLIHHSVVVDVVMADGKIVIRDPASGKVYLVNPADLAPFLSGDLLVLP